MSTVTGQRVITGLMAKATADNPGASGKAQIGNQSLTTGLNEGDAVRNYPDADRPHSFKITAAAPANVATLTLSSGAIAQTTGSPVIDGAGVDFQGDALLTSTKLHAIRVRTPASNTGTVTLAGSSSGLLPAIVLQADSEIILKLPVAGLAHSTATQSYTFSAGSDKVFVEYLGQTAP